MNGWQTLSVVLMTSGDWPDAVKFVQQYVLQTVNLDFISLASPACLGAKMNFYYRFVGTLGGVCCLVGGVWLFSIKAFRQRRRKAAAWSRAKALRLHDSMLLVLLVYTLVTAQGFYFFRCLRVESSSSASSSTGANTTTDTWFLISDLSIECYDTTWYAMLPLVLVVIVGFSLGLPLGIVYFLWRRKHRLEEEKIVKLFGILYKPYKARFFYFESVMMGFKLLLLVALVFSEPDSQSQHASIMLVSVIELLVHARLQPFSSTRKNILQFLGNVLTASMAFGGVMLSYAHLGKNEAALRLSGEELDRSNETFDAYLGLIRGILDAVLYTCTIPPIIYFVYTYRTWVHRKKHIAI